MELAIIMLLCLKKLFVMARFILINFIFGNVKLEISTLIYIFSNAFLTEIISLFSKATTNASGNFFSIRFFSVTASS